MKPYSESCDQNKAPILNVILPLFADRTNLLEIGSGTGQHAVCFAKAMPHLSWQTSDLEENHAGINLWLEEAQLDTIKSPISLAACDHQAWCELGTRTTFDTIFSANSVHIMGEEDVICLFKEVGSILESGGLFVLYGPFNDGGKYTSESNARFDRWLKNHNPKSGIRDFEWLDSLANDAGLELHKDYEMPANNKILVWKKTSTVR